MNTITAGRQKAKAKKAAANPQPEGQPASEPYALPAVPPIASFQPFPLELLPANLRPFIEEGARVQDVDPSLLVAFTLAIAGGLVGNARFIRLLNTWSEAPIIWTMAVCESGSNKTGPWKMCMRPVFDMRKANRVDVTAKKRQFFTSDITIEKAYQVMELNPRGLLYSRDEISMWFKSFCRYKKDGSSDSAAWLEFSTPVTTEINRKCGDVSLWNACLSITGTCQPKIIAAVFANGALFDAGGPYRFLYVAPPIRKRRLIKEPMADKHLAAWEAVCVKLANLDGEFHLPLAPKAEKLWDEYFENSAEIEYNDTAIMRGAHGKLRAYAARLALLHHLIGKHGGGLAIGEESMAAGIGMSGWFRAESERIFLMRDETNFSRDLRYLAERIAGRGGRITVRDLHISMRRQFPTAEACKQNLDALVSQGYGVWEKEGRQKEVFVLQQKPVEEIPEIVAAEEPEEVPEIAPAETTPSLYQDTPTGMLDLPPECALMLIRAGLTTAGHIMDIRQEGETIEQAIAKVVPAVAKFAPRIKGALQCATSELVPRCRECRRMIGLSTVEGRAKMCHQCMDQAAAGKQQRRAS